MADSIKKPSKLQTNIQIKAPTPPNEIDEKKHPTRFKVYTVKYLHMFTLKKYNKKKKE